MLLRNVNRKSQVADRSVAVPMTLSDLERCQNFSADLCNYARTVLPERNKLGIVIYVAGGAYFYGLSYSPSQRGGTPALPNFWIPLYLCETP